MRMDLSLQEKKYIEKVWGVLLSKRMSPLDLAKYIKVKKSEYSILQSLLTKLVLSMKVGIDSDGLLFASENPVLEGKIQIHNRGFGFVSNDSLKNDIFIPKHKVNKAFNGDQVLVELLDKTEKGIEGKVVSVINRKQSEVIGFVVSTDHNFIMVKCPQLNFEEIQVEIKKKSRIHVGDRLLLKIIKWTKDSDICELEILKHLGNIDDPSKDVQAIIEERKIISGFTSKITRDAVSCSKFDSNEEAKKRKDLRSLNAFTIDPDTAKDFDDALSIEKIKGGGYILGVHIADVAHFVPLGSKLDLEARQRGNSTYLLNCCIPMLPSVLADDACSLREMEDRLTASIIIKFDKTGKVKDYEIFRSIIRSRKRFTYAEAKEILDNKKGEFYQEIKLMEELCLKLKKFRKMRGSLDFSLDDTRIICSHLGEPMGIEKTHYDITHQMVEEFMIKTNEIVAKHLSDLNVPIIYRVHEKHSKESLQDFINSAKSYGLKIPKKNNEVDLQALFDIANDTDYKVSLIIEYIRSMKMAFYKSENIGHFGLGLDHYCHFTSPIRRYSDLVVMRALFGETMDPEDLRIISLHISESERNSTKAENALIALKKIRLLKNMFDQGQKQFNAKICKIKSTGICFEIVDLSFESFIKVSKICDEFLFFDEDKVVLKSNSGIEFAVGDFINVEIVSVDLASQSIEWKCVDFGGRKKRQYKANNYKLKKKNK